MFFFVTYAHFMWRAASRRRWKRDNVLFGDQLDAPAMRSFHHPLFFGKQRFWAAEAQQHGDGESGSEEGDDGQMKLEDDDEEARMRKQNGGDDDIHLKRPHRAKAHTKVQYYHLS